MTKLSVIIPAYNEEKCLPETLRRIRTSLTIAACSSEVIVVDNESLDRTREIAEAFGARVVQAKDRNISFVRNTGAKNAAGDILIFIDADTLVPETLFQEIAGTLQDEKCFGGAVAVEYGDVNRTWMKLYLMAWEFWGFRFNMKQGAAQFCRQPVFLELNGYDETIFVGEDIEFYWRLSKFAKRNNGYLHFIARQKVITSSRRFNQLNPWRTLLLTHPAFIFLAWRKKALWKDWYENAIR